MSVSPSIALCRNADGDGGDDDDDDDDDDETLQMLADLGVWYLKGLSGSLV